MLKKCWIDMLSLGDKLLRNTYELNYGRNIISSWCTKYINTINDKKIKILDIGCGNAVDIINIYGLNKDKDIVFYGVDLYQLDMHKFYSDTVNYYYLDIERDNLPFNDEYFDIVIANQVLEHTKDIWWITSEISRVIKKGGIFLVGVPNLLSLHNQLLMLLGRHPISIEIVGPHVRGFTIDGFSRFIKLDNYFELLKVAGSNFYPFPINISKIACKLFPMWSVGIFFLVQRTSRVGNFIHTLDSRLYETAYFRGK